MKAGIITIGNEILKGKTVNTNAADIGRILYFSGYEIIRGLVVPDIESEIGWAFHSLLEICDVIISTGGLGPTFDDITIQSFAREFKIPLVLDQETFRIIKERTEARGLQMTDERTKMAFVPEGSKIIKNTVGTAPGIKYNLGDKRIFILPGVPREMKAMLEIIASEIKIKDNFYFENSIIVKGIYEATLAPLIKEIMEKYSGMIYIKSHPSLTESGLSVLEIEVAGRGKTIDDAKNISSSAIRDIDLGIKKILNH